jgi:hypothetical protein
VRAMFPGTLRTAERCSLIIINKEKRHAVLKPNLHLSRRRSPAVRPFRSVHFWVQCLTICQQSIKLQIVACFTHTTRCPEISDISLRLRMPMRILTIAITLFEMRLSTTSMYALMKALPEGVARKVRDTDEFRDQNLPISKIGQLQSIV